MSEPLGPDIPDDLRPPLREPRVTVPDPTTEALSIEATERRAWAASEGAVRYNLNVGDLTMEEQTDALRLIRGLSADVNTLVARLREYEGALRKIADQQPKTLAMIERNGFVFDSIGCERGSWQHLAFTIYTDLCEVDTVARATLAASPGGGADE